MLEKLVPCAAVAALVGCGGAAVAPIPQATTTANMPTLATTNAGEESPVDAPLDGPSTAAIAIADPALLPAPPWADTALASAEVPAELLAAWERADNREWCAPIAPTNLGAAAGARARATNYEGGWAVEFDRRGMPGMARDGERCERCGRGVFGIAGTGMTPEELAGEAAELTPSFGDGSHAEIEVGEDNVAAATITLPGQGCVYQVWSFLGREHVEELVASLRRVEPTP